MESEHIMILGVGCILFSDEGFGVRVIEKLEERYTFPQNVSIVDGGALGVNLLGVISQADQLIVVDAIRNQGNPGDLYRLAGEQIPQRIRAKNSIHQVDFLEALGNLLAGQTVEIAGIALISDGIYHNQLVGLGNDT